MPALPLPMGSYLLILARPGFRPVRAAVLVERSADVELAVTLYGENELPDGFVQVPAGPFLYQGDPENPYGGPRERREAPDFFLARHPVTCRQYLAFLRALDRADPEQAGRRVPRASEDAGCYWPRGEDGSFVLPTASWLASAPAALRERARRLDQAPADWEEDWPVLGVSWEDMMALAAHRTAETGHLLSLPHEVEWEKAARGADGRCFPWGDHADATFCNMNRSWEEGMRPCPVGGFPDDESPYGVRGLGGNARDVVINDPGPPLEHWRLFRGGAWRNAGLDLRAAVRAAALPSNVNNHLGGRLVLVPRLAGPQA